MKKFTTLLSLLVMLLAFSLNAQVAINNDGSNADANSVLHVKDGNDNEALYIEAATGEVGIGTTNPSQKLDVSGNMRISGAIMPGNDAGTSGQLLMSEGPGAAATWGAEMLNRSQTTAIGKYFVGPFDILGYSNKPRHLELTVTDANCTQTSTCFITWTGDLPSGPFYGDLTCSVEAQTGQWIFHFTNNTNNDLLNFQFSFVAFY
jgi:hypothetical protein